MRSSHGPCNKPRLDRDTNESCITFSHLENHDACDVFDPSIHPNIHLTGAVEVTVHFAANGLKRKPTKKRRSSFIQTEVSRAEKIKRGKKVSRIHLNLDGIIREGGREGQLAGRGRRAGRGGEGELPGYVGTDWGGSGSGGTMYPREICSCRDYVGFLTLTVMFFLNFQN